MNNVIAGITHLDTALSGTVFTSNDSLVGRFTESNSFVRERGFTLGYSGINLAARIYSTHRDAVDISASHDVQSLVNAPYDPYLEPSTSALNAYITRLNDRMPVISIDIRQSLKGKSPIATAYAFTGDHEIINLLGFVPLQAAKYYWHHCQRYVQPQGKETAYDNYTQNLRAPEGTRLLFLALSTEYIGQEALETPTNRELVNAVLENSRSVDPKEADRVRSNLRGLAKNVYGVAAHTHAIKGFVGAAVLIR
jgi:hypothetical protein